MPRIIRLRMAPEQLVEAWQLQRNQDEMSATTLRPHSAEDDAAQLGARRRGGSVNNRCMPRKTAIGMGSKAPVTGNQQ
jgi:hypothetical protein